jgi:cell division septum initiation protein DivIVA
MTENDRITLANFEEKLHLLLHEHKQLQSRNKELAKLIEEKENSLKEMQMRCSSLESSYNNLKQAKIISLSDAEIGQTRERLSKLVREIDQCIESLKKQ